MSDVGVSMYIQTRPQMPMGSGKPLLLTSMPYPDPVVKLMCTAFLPECAMVGPGVVVNVLATLTVAPSVLSTVQAAPSMVPDSKSSQNAAPAGHPAAPPSPLPPIPDPLIGPASAPPPLPVPLLDPPPLLEPVALPPLLDPPLLELLPLELPVLVPLPPPLLELPLAPLLLPPLPLPAPVAPLLDPTSPPLDPLLEPLADAVSPPEELEEAPPVVAVFALPPDPHAKEQQAKLTMKVRRRPNLRVRVIAGRFAGGLSCGESSWTIALGGVASDG